MMANHDVFLVDLALTSDLELSPTGDVEWLSGQPNVKVSLLHRLITRPGSIIHRPDYGCGIQDFQNMPLTLPIKRQIAQRIGQQFIKDPRVEKVLSVNILQDKNNTAQVTISVLVELTGLGDQSIQFNPFDAGVI